ncbi:hypothetical protein [Bartonella quintana]|uniref:hypothetical protein n=1 Tax=Bartonella quintana TaxID=803 RepID=UPI00027FCD5F|nr:hypothetical protein [Bartonella quintana]AFR26741.1 hypothetical protein RM11_1041 [Bartonella quintana RM-11]
MFNRLNAYACSNKRQKGFILQASLPHHTNVQLFGRVMVVKLSAGVKQGVHNKIMDVKQRHFHAKLPKPAAIF